MQLLAPDLLAEAQGLSTLASGGGVAVGLLVWLFGWRGHRFWIVVAITLVGGVLGLYSSPTYGVQPLVGGLLLAVAAGAMALALVRLVAFASAGAVTWLAVHALIPNFDEPAVCFLAGGLAGLLLFRLWTMVLTSLGGSVLAGYSLLLLLHKVAKLDAAAWAGKHDGLLNGACFLMAVAGVGLQFWAERRRLQKEREQQEQEAIAKAAEEEKKQKELQKQKEQQQLQIQQQKAARKKGTWWGWAQQTLQKMAG
jgi:hypothetical protein